MTTRWPTFTATVRPWRVYYVNKAKPLTLTAEAARLAAMSAAANERDRQFPTFGQGAMYLTVGGPALRISMIAIR